MPPSPADTVPSRLFVGPALRTQPDRRLVTLVREGYEAAFEEIVRRYGKPLGRYAAAIVGTRAEDVTQDAFSKALLALRRDGSEIELRPWLYRIVRNTALNDLRDRPPSSQELEEAIEGGRSASEEAERREEIAELMSRLRALPEPQRAAIVMRELEGLSHDEIAAALGLTGGAARQAIYRARVALRDGLGMLIPVPLLRMLIDHGTEAATAGAGAGGAAVAAGASVGGAGAGGALKIGVATALLAGSVGAGVALNEHGHSHRGSSPAAAAAAPLRGEDAAASDPQGSQPSAVNVAAESRRVENRRGQGGSGHDGHGRDGHGGHGRGELEPEGGDDSGGGRSFGPPLSGFTHHDGTSGMDGGSGRGGPGGEHGSGQDVPGGHSGPGPGSSSGPGSGSGGGEPEPGEPSGSGGGGSGGEGSGSSGGPGPDGGPPPPADEGLHGHGGSSSDSSSGSGGNDGEGHP